ncbi:MAG: hypothetical protein COC17_08345 [Hyphomicrobiales bacterium]|nr:MAG: hypothetical protein COC17_08345 [Hyphomicrobiales bacterium]
MHFISNSNVPKRVFFWWRQGVENAPKIVSDTWALWEYLNPDYEIVYISEEMIEEVKTAVGPSFNSIPSQAQSDVVRVYFLNKIGGLWIDSGTIPIRPLDSWLPKLITSNFFAYHDPRSGRAIESWFLVSSPEHPLIKAWYELIVEYWSEPKTVQSNKYQLENSFRGAISRLVGKFTKSQKRKIYTQKDNVWAVDQDGGAQFGFFPYF